MKNNIDYKTDVSFFGYITVLDVSSFHETIVKWMEAEPNSHVRLLVDKQADDDYVSFSEIQRFLPTYSTPPAITLEPDTAWAAPRYWLAETP